MFNETFGHFRVYILEWDNNEYAMEYYDYWCSLKEGDCLEEKEIKERGITIDEYLMEYTSRNS